MQAAGTSTDEASSSQPAAGATTGTGERASERAGSSSGGSGGSSKRRRGCNCKKSKCLKLYCDCFAGQINCTQDCNCQNCFNTAEHDGDIRDARQMAIDRNATAFKPK